MLAKVHSFWFAEGPAARLAILRMASGSFILWYLITRYQSILRMAQSPHALFEPVGLASYLHTPLAAGPLEVVLMATIVLNLLFVLGFWHKWTGPIFGILVLFVFSYRNSWSMIYHARNIAVMHVLILGLAPAADALSFDALWRGGRPPDSWHYGWPVRLLCLVTVLTYCLAGIAKVAGPVGWSWAFGEALRDQVAIDALRKQVLGSAPTDLAFTIYPFASLFTAIGVMTLILELGAPLALLHRRIGYLWAVAVLGMHWGIWFIMGITFRYQLSGLMLLCFFPVERPLAWLARLIRIPPSYPAPAVLASHQAQPPEDQDDTGESRHPAAMTVFYDGVCNFCNETVQFILARDAAAQFCFAPLQAPLGRDVLRALGKDAASLDTIILVDGDRAYVKSTAILRILLRLGGPWSLAWLFVAVPAVVRDAVYDFIAARRYRWFGRTQACVLPSPEVRDRFASGP